MTQTLDMEKLAKAVKTKRVIDLNITLREAAKKSKVTFATISRIENKKTTELPNLIKISNWVGIPLSEFIIVKK